MLAALLILAAPAPFPQPVLKGPPLSLARPEGFWRQDFTQGGFRVHLLLPGGKWICLNEDGKGGVARGYWKAEEGCRWLSWLEDWRPEGGGWSRSGGGAFFSHMFRIG